MTTKCQFLQLNHCTLIQSMSRVDLDATVADTHCEHCNSCSVPRNVNRFTVCETLYRLRVLNKFCIERHGQLVSAAQCTLGAGTILHAKIHWLQFRECGCQHKVSIMNSWGPNECSNQIEVILDWMKESSIFMKVKFIRKAMKLILEDSIQESLQLHTKYNMHWIYNV